ADGNDRARPAPAQAEVRYGYHVCRHRHGRRGYFRSRLSVADQRQPSLLLARDPHVLSCTFRSLAPGRLGWRRSARFPLWHRGRQMIYKLAVAIIALTLSSVLGAAEVGGVKLDDKISLGGQELVLNGAGIRTRAIFKVYVASLYAPQKTADPAGVLAKGPRRIQLNLLRTLSADQLADALND